MVYYDIHMNPTFFHSSESDESSPLLAYVWQW